jgi:DNA-binding NtrC family response regulator
LERTLGDDLERTLSDDTDASLIPPPATSTYLFRVFSYDRPLLPPARHDLSDIVEVRIGRGERAAVREGDRLAIGARDPRISTKHARLRRVAEGWSIEDLNSRNGTAVGGASVQRALLGDGDWIECGRTIFRFRTGLPALAGSDPDTEATGPTLETRTLSPAFSQDIQRFARVAASRVPLVLAGETGTGKELAARAAHALSGRRGAFVAVNCAALPAALVEGELFGHRRGAFSGAIEDRPGLLRSAEGGTLLLDEVGDLSMSAQASLLRALQERQVMSVGATRPVPVDFRLIVAGQRPLEDLVREGRFRPDLLARTAGFTLLLPPLHERAEDLGLLIAALLPRLTPTPEAVTFTKGAARALFGHRFPLNVRELEKALETALVLAGDAPIDRVHLPDAITRSGETGPSGGTTGSSLPLPAPSGAEDSEGRATLIALLEEHRGNISAIARVTGKARVQIRRSLRRHGMDPARFRDE